MADLVITPTSVAVPNNSAGTFVKFGEAVTQGQVVYRSTADNKYSLADCDASATARAIGIVISNVAADDYGYFLGGSGVVINLGVTLAQGEYYVVSDTAGNIMPIGDLTTGQYITQLGIAESTSLLRMRVYDSQITHA